MEQMFRLYLNLDSQYKVISNKIYFLYTQESRALVTDIPRTIRISSPRIEKRIL